MSADPLPLYDAPWVWQGPEMAAQPDRWIWQLGPAEVAELDETVRRLDASGRDIVTFTAADAPLPGITRRLAEVQNDLMYGIGFSLIRGLRVEDYTLRQAGIALWAIGAHLGEAVPQNAKGHLLGHVRDLGFDYDKPSARGYQTNHRLPYHCDSGDAVGLLALRTAKAGGLSSIVSSVALYNAIANDRPDLARVLMQPTYRDRRDEIPADRGPWYTMPVFIPHHDRLFGHYVRSVIRKAQRFEDVPRVTPEQEEAFDTLDALACDPAFHLDMQFEPGDMQFLCNHSILHSRTQYQDWDAPERKRHMLRLWLGCPNGPDMPAVYEEQQGLTAAGRPAGIHCPGAALNAPMEVEDGGAGISAKRAFDAARPSI